MTGSVSHPKYDAEYFSKHSAAKLAYSRFKHLDYTTNPEYNPNPTGWVKKIKDSDPAGYKKLWKLVQSGYMRLPSYSLKIVPEYEALKAKLLAEADAKSKKRGRSASSTRRGRSASRSSKRTRKN